MQATGAGIAIALGGILRDLAALYGGAAFGYTFVYTLELVLLVLTMMAIRPLIGSNSFDPELSNNKRV